MLGLVREIPSCLRKRVNLVSTLSRNKHLNRARLEAVVQGGDFSETFVDEHSGHLRFPSGGVGITNSSKGPSELVDQGGPGRGRMSAQLRLGDNRRYSPEVSHRFAFGRGLSRPVLRRTSQCVCSCRQGSGAVAFHTSRPGGKDAGDFTSRPTPGGEIRRRDSPEVLNGPLDTGYRPRPIFRVPA